MSEVSPRDTRWLDAAVRLAQPWLGTTADRPTVAALIVAEDLQLVFGRAVTGRGGRPHAEALALADARSSARGRTLYVTLEPDPGRERLPPVVDAILEAGVARVVIGIADPDLRVAGAGIRRLRGAGVEVAVADHEPSRRLHEGYLRRQAAARPAVSVRLAISRDGMIGLPGTGRVPIVGEEARRWCHMLRATSDAVLVGARTAELDDPQLTVRIGGVSDRTHLRVVLAGAGPFNTRLNLFDWVSGYPTAIIAETARRFDVPPSIETISVEGRKGRPDLRRALGALAEKGVGNLLVEGGARLTESLLAGEFVDRFHLLEGDLQLGRKGVPATALGTIDGRLRAAGLIEVDRRRFGDDKLRTFEREF